MKIFKTGSRGWAVTQIQKTLNVYPDGIFGKLTAEAVQDFQRRSGLTPDGIVGPATLAKLMPQIGKPSRRHITEIIVHCTATPEGKDYTVQDIRYWHTQPVSKGGRGWSDIGYHYIVYRDGSIHKGRDVDISGAHCVGHNSNSIGVCYVGGVEKDGRTAKDTRTLRQREALEFLLRFLREVYPNVDIRGHRDFAAKECPSFDATKEYRYL